ncbi:molecular chaperone DnaJ [Microbacterium sp. H6]|uniref:molecular chaperone DnaJ n=1 Tax=Microbacterium sp. H6 TaxID=421122 RepID=UPI000DE35050|nr:molecular chaperone DnaJ [Microbacterium sp. H6]RBO73500.1 molecular chaperone DnaJ [Microbacterium sp. H6]
MIAWPESMKVGPIGEWPTALTANRQPSKFSAPLSDTLTLLDREIYQLVETRAQQESAELLIAVPPGAFRADGRPYANAKPEHPGVIFSIDAPFGHLSYPCDTYPQWQDNLRAIAKTLEALRMVERYGVSKRSEQYRGFLAIEATATPAGFANLDEAWTFLCRLVESEGTVLNVATARVVLRNAQRATHPDHGGDAAIFQRVTLAEAKLRAEGWLK